jgi:transcriptional regulator with PAS, ATPase and Fis domain
MRNTNWTKEAPFAITVTDADGTIIEMNDRSAVTFEKDGGRNLIGKQVMDCHPEPARSKLRALLQEHASNIYTIEKNGVKKIIIQVPWTAEGKFAGMVELSIELPPEIPHFIRK